MRLTVVEDPTASPALREGVRAALGELDHDVDYSTDGAANVYERVFEIDAAIILDSNVTQVTALYIGWYIRTLPILVVCDASAPGKAMFAALKHDHRFINSDGQDTQALYEFLIGGLRSIEVEPDRYISYHLLNRNVEDSPRPRDTVFISYSHRDAGHLDRLLVHLEPLRRAGRVKYWSDQQLRPGSRWREEIGEAIAAASIAVLLRVARLLG